MTLHGQEPKLTLDTRRQAGATAIKAGTDGPESPNQQAFQERAMTALRERIADPSFGAWVSSDPLSCEIMGWAGYDWLILETPHRNCACFGYRRRTAGRAGRQYRIGSTHGDGCGDLPAARKALIRTGSHLCPLRNT